ncbi:MAG: hypothetical protein E7667_00520 [Ruminococcaceae bacterium]|nr:hypothetical protein [Oscillospiraceae bacterium]
MNTQYKTAYPKIDKDFVAECDAKFDRMLNMTTDRICKDRDVRVVGITGPTCSGKTTAAKKVIGYYRSHGIKLHVISLDDFFKDQFSREDEIDPKNVDFDSPDTFDTEEFYSFVTDLFSNGEAQKPIFDFVTGDRSRRETVINGDGDVFLFEGIQLLYPQVDKIIRQMNGKSIYLCAESGIQVGDISVSKEELRLMRRLVRDSNFRAADPIFTLDLWESVRRNEDINILPYAHRCDICIDTTLEYELNILKPYLEKILGEIAPDSEHYSFCRRVLDMLSGINDINREVLSDNSLYNEFV